MTTVMRDIASYKAALKFLQKARANVQDDLTEVEDVSEREGAHCKEQTGLEAAASAVVEALRDDVRHVTHSNATLPKAIAGAKQERAEAQQTFVAVKKELDGVMSELGWGFASTDIDTKECG